MASVSCMEKYLKGWAQAVEEIKEVLEMSSTKWENKMIAHNIIAVPMTRKTSIPEGKKILVVDDNEIILHVISCIMKRADYKVTTAKNGIAALDALYRQDFDLLITDLVMPGMDGITLLKKAKGLYPNLRVIILTGSPHLVPQPIEGINVDALLAKPVYQADLLSHVAYCLNRRNPSKSDNTRPV
jgi:CheY-like chemotaxis protein